MECPECKDPNYYDAFGPNCSNPDCDVKGDKVGFRTEIKCDFEEGPISVRNPDLFNKVFCNICGQNTLCSCYVHNTKTGETKGEYDIESAIKDDPKNVWNPKNYRTKIILTDDENNKVEFEGKLVTFTEWNGVSEIGIQISGNMIDVPISRDKPLCKICHNFSSAQICHSCSQNVMKDALQHYKQNPANPKTV